MIKREQKDWSNQTRAEGPEELIKSGGLERSNEGGGDGIIKRE